MIKMSNLIAASFLASFLAFPLDVKAQEHRLVGVNYPPLPEGVERVGGWLINRSYTIRRVSSEGQTLLLLSRLLRRDSQGKGFYKVVDVLTLPLMYKTEEISPGSSCTVNGEEASNFITIMKSNDNTPYLTKARKAWWVGGETFKEVNVQDFQFKCENLSYGL